MKVLMHEEGRPYTREVHPYAYRTLTSTFLRGGGEERLPLALATDGLACMARKNRIARCIATCAYIFPLPKYAAFKHYFYDFLSEPRNCYLWLLQEHASQADPSMLVRGQSGLRRKDEKERGLHKMRGKARKKLGVDLKMWREMRRETVRELQSLDLTRSSEIGWKSARHGGLKSIYGGGRGLTRGMGARLTPQISRPSNLGRSCESQSDPGPRTDFRYCNSRCCVCSFQLNPSSSIGNCFHLDLFRTIRVRGLINFVGLGLLSLDQKFDLERIYCMRALARNGELTEQILSRKMASSGFKFLLLSWWTLF